jgi:hypothetical protein
MSHAAQPPQHHSHICVNARALSTKTFCGLAIPVARSGHVAPPTQLRAVATELELLEVGFKMRFANVFSPKHLIVPLLKCIPANALIADSRSISFETSPSSIDTKRNVAADTLPEVTICKGSADQGQPLMRDLRSVQQVNPVETMLQVGVVPSSNINNGSETARNPKSCF